MLVLSRKVGERVIIDDRITVTVVRVQGGQARLGVEAPADVAIYREEIRPLPPDASSTFTATN